MQKRFERFECVSDWQYVLCMYKYVSSGEGKEHENRESVSSRCHKLQQIERVRKTVQGRSEPSNDEVPSDSSHPVSRSNPLQPNLER